MSTSGDPRHRRRAAHALGGPLGLEPSLFGVEQNMRMTEHRGRQRDTDRYVHDLEFEMQLEQTLSGILGPSQRALRLLQKSQARSTLRFLEPFPSAEESMA